MGRPGNLRVAERFRSTWVVSSLAALDRRGLHERYLSHLPLTMRAEVGDLVPGTWIPLATAAGHYRACDEIGLSEDEIAAIGVEVSSPMRSTFLSSVVGLVRAVGGTTETALTHVPRLWRRFVDGGELVVERLGPRHVRISVWGCSLFDIPYFATGHRALALGVGLLLTKDVSVHEMRSLCSPERYVYEATWR